MFVDALQTRRREEDLKMEERLETAVFFGVLSSRSPTLLAQRARYFNEQSDDAPEPVDMEKVALSLATAFPGAVVQRDN